MTSVEPRSSATNRSASRITELLGMASIEITSRDDFGAAAGLLTPGADIYVGFLPHDDHRRNAAIAKKLRDSGFSPVAHVPVREFASIAELDDYLARLAGEARVERVLGIGGDLFVPRGPLVSTIQLVESGLLQKHGIGTIEFAGHPEGHPYLDKQAAFEILSAKVAAARAGGLRTGVVSQFCFSAAPIVTWLRELPTHRLDIDLRIGVAGPANPISLVKFALRCGVGDSLSVMQRHAARVTRLAVDASPDEVVFDLARAMPALPASRVKCFHFFPFGGLAKTARWIRSAIRRAENIALA
jgi:methylenetetrahydrofolate reductase (NADPH)